MSEKKKKPGPRPKPPEEVKSITKAVRVSPDLNDEIAKTAQSLGLAESDLLRVGIIYLLKDMDSEDFDLLKLYKDAATT